MTFSFNSRLLRKTRKAFTLVELLASAGIMLVVVSSTLGVTVNVMNSWNRATESLTMDRMAQQVFTLMQSDINGMVIKNDGDDWMLPSAFSGSSTLPLSTDPVDGYLFFPTVARVRPRTYVSGGTETALQGSVCAVLYRMAWQNPFNTSDTDASKKRYGLYRGVVDPEKLASTTTWSDLVKTSHTINGLLDEGLERSFSGTLIDYAKEPYNLVCERVVSFEALAYSVSALGSVTWTKGMWVPSWRSASTGSVSILRPAQGIEVKMRIVTEEGADLLRHGSASLWDAEFVRQYTKLYSRRFPIQISPY